MDITRRDFVMAAGAAAGAAVLGQGQHAFAGEFTGKIKKALKYNMVKTDLRVEENFRMLKEIGYDGVELGFGDKVDPQEALAASKSTGLPIHGVVLGSVNGINAAVDRAKLYGATSVLLVAGRVDGKMPYAQNYTETQETIRAAIPYAEEQQILLLVENVWNNFLLSPLEMARYIDELDSPAVGVYFDLGNVARLGWSEHWIPVLGERIKKLDIKDYSRTKQMEEGPWKGFGVKIGDGEIDWAACRRELAKIGYEGWLTAEVDGGPKEELADICARLNKVLDI